MINRVLFRFWFRWLFFWVLGVALPFPLLAMELASPCDTLLTNTGEQLLVRVESIEDGVVRFYDCGDSTRLKERWMGNIQEVRLGKIPPEQSVKSKKNKERERLIKKINRRTGSTLLLGLFSMLFWLIALIFPPLLIVSFPLGAIAFGLGIWIVWKSRDLPGLRRQRGVGVFGIVAGGLNLLLLLFWLILILLFF
jgi:hypothetical protein